MGPLLPPRPAGVAPGRARGIPCVAAIASNRRPEGGGGDCGSTSGGYDQLRIGTLMYAK